MESRNAEEGDFAEGGLDGWVGWRSSEKRKDREESGGKERQEF